MTLYEAYSYLYDNRKKNPILRGRFLSAFNYWRNGTGPNEDAQRRHLLQAGFRNSKHKGWVAPGNFLNLDVITISVHIGELGKVPFEQFDNRCVYSEIGEYWRIHIAGSKTALKKIQYKFGIPKKMK